MEYNHPWYVLCIAWYGKSSNGGKFKSEDYGATVFYLSWNIDLKSGIFT